MTVRTAALGAVLAAMALAAGCSWMVRTQAFRYDQVKRAAKPDDYPIPILADTTRIGRPYVVIGMVQAEGGGVEGIGDRELREGLRKEARRLGGDALINLQLKPSIYATTGHGADARDRARPPDRVRYRWVAEVISFDLPERASGRP